MKIRDLPIAIQIRLWGGSLNRVITSSIFPFLALYLSDMFSKEFTSIFLMFTVIASFVISLYSGYIIDFVPRRKLLLISSFSEALCYILMTFFIYTMWTVPFICSYILLLIFSSFRSPVLKVLIQDSVNEENRDLTYRLDYWLINLSMSFGVLLGGALYSNHKTLLFLLASISSIILFLVYFRYIEDIFIVKPKKIISYKLSNLISSYSEVLLDTKFTMLTLGITFIFTAETVTSSYLSVRLHENFHKIEFLNIDGVKMFSIMQFTNTIIVAIFTLFIGKFIKKNSKKRFFIFGMILYIVGYSINLSLNTWYLLILFMIIATIGEIIYAPIYNTEIIKLMPKTKRGSYNAFSGLSSTGAEMLGRLSILVGSMISQYTMTIVLSVFLFLGALILSKNLFGDS